MRPIHGALYLWLVELCNRKGWALEFPAPATECMQACGIHSYNTYKKALNELADWGFIEVVLPSKNQYTSNVIALSENNKAPYKALDKALATHDTKHLQSTVQSTDSNIKQETLDSTTTITPSGGGAELPLGGGSIKTVELLAQDALRDTVHFIPAALKQLGNNCNLSPQDLGKVRDRMPELMDDFVLHLKSEDVHRKDTQGFRAHFKNWICKRTRGELTSSSAQIVKFLNCAAGAYGTMPLADWNRLHANNPNTTLKLIAQ